MVVAFSEYPIFQMGELLAEAPHRQCLTRAQVKPGVTGARKHHQHSLDKQAQGSYYVLIVAIENALVRSPRNRPDPARKLLARSLEGCASKEDLL